MMRQITASTRPSLPNSNARNARQTRVQVASPRTFEVVTTSVPPSAHDASPLRSGDAASLAHLAAASGCPFFRRLLQPLPERTILEQLTTKFDLAKAVTRLVLAEAPDPLINEKKVFAGGKPVAVDDELLPTSVVVGDPRWVKAVLADADSFNPEFEQLAAMVGDSLTLASGEHHNKLRRFMAQYFAPAEVAKYTPRLEQLGAKYLDMLVEGSEGLTNTQQGPSCTAVMELYAFEAIMRIVACIDISESDMCAFKTDLKHMVAGYFCGLPVNNKLAQAGCTPLGQAMAARARARRRIDGWVQAARQRMLRGEPAVSMLDDFVRHVDANGERLTDGELRDNLMGIFFAGFETTSASLVSMVHFLHTQPEEAGKLLQEQQEVSGEFGEGLSAKSLRSMKALDRFIREAMRVRNPLPGLVRKAQHDMQMGQHVLRKGDYAILAMRYIAAHDPEWEGCEGDLAPQVFNPDRFLQPGSGANQIPFGHGKHSCIGMNLALMEIKVMLALMLRKYKLKGVAEPAAWHYRPTLTPVNGLPVLLERNATS